MLKYALIAGIALLTFSNPSQGQSWKDKYVQAQDSYSKENYDQAFSLADEALKGYLAEGTTNPENHAAILRLISTICYVQQKLPEGLEFVKKEILLRETKKDTAYAVALMNQAQFEEQMGANDQAVKTLLICRPVLTQYYKADDLRVLECDLKLAINYYFMNDYAKANEWFTPALTAVEKKQEYTEEVLEGFYYAGMLYVETGKSNQAVTTFSKTNQIYISADLTKTLSYPMVLYGLAYAYHKDQSHLKAEDSYREAQSIYENLAGKEGDNYLTILGARVVNLHYLDKQAQADELWNQLKKNPEGKLAYASACASLAAFYHRRGRAGWTWTA